MTTLFRNPLALAPWLATSMLAVAGAIAADKPLSFNHDIRPVLSSKCFACHGFDAKKREADLRLDVPEGALADRDGTPAITPGLLEKSEVWRRINSTDEDEMMPPPAAKKQLTTGERELIKRWIEQGAPYQKHWAFEPIVRPSLPLPLGEGRGEGARNSANADTPHPNPLSKGEGTASPIDAFLNQRLTQAGLTPQPPADSDTLMRR